jgi:hypothetical protein
MNGQPIFQMIPRVYDNALYYYAENQRRFQVQTVILKPDDQHIRREAAGRVFVK